MTWLLPFSAVEMLQLLITALKKQEYILFKFSFIHSQRRSSSLMRNNVNWSGRALHQFVVSFLYSRVPNAGAEDIGTSGRFSSFPLAGNHPYT